MYITHEVIGGKRKINYIIIYIADSRLGERKVKAHNKEVGGHLGVFGGGLWSGTQTIAFL